VPDILSGFGKYFAEAPEEHVSGAAYTHTNQRKNREFEKEGTWH
jgi:hypothetical protein